MLGIARIEKGTGSDGVLTERMASMMIGGTAVLLATAAVVYTVVGNSPHAPSASELPVITVAARLGTGTDKIPPIVPSGGAATTAGPSSASDGSGTSEKGGATRPARGGTAGSPRLTPSSPAASLPATGTKSSEDDHDREVVRPKVHESDDRADESDDERGSDSSR